MKSGVSHVSDSGMWSRSDSRRLWRIKSICRRTTVFTLSVSSGWKTWEKRINEHFLGGSRKVIDRVSATARQQAPFSTCNSLRYCKRFVGFADSNKARISLVDLVGRFLTIPKKLRTAAYDLEGARPASSRTKDFQRTGYQRVYSTIMIGIVSKSVAQR